MFAEDELLPISALQGVWATLELGVAGGEIRLACQAGGKDGMLPSSTTGEGWSI